MLALNLIAPGVLSLHQEPESDNHADFDEMATQQVRLKTYLHGDAKIARKKGRTHLTIILQIPKG